MRLLPLTYQAQAGVGLGRMKEMRAEMEKLWFVPPQCSGWGGGWQTHKQCVKSIKRWVQIHGGHTPQFAEGSPGLRQSRTGDLTSQNHGELYEKDSCRHVRGHDWHRCAYNSESTLIWSSKIMAKKTWQVERTAGHGSVRCDDNSSNRAKVGLNWSSCKKRQEAIHLNITCNMDVSVINCDTHQSSTSPQMMGFTSSHSALFLTWNCQHLGLVSKGEWELTLSSYPAWSLRTWWCP